MNTHIHCTNSAVIQTLIILLDHRIQEKTFLLGVVIIVHAEILCTIFTLHTTSTKI